MFKIIDEFLNNITMYRLVLYYLIILAFAGLIYTLTGTISHDPVNYIFSITFILSICIAGNYFFAKVFDAPTNVESIYISALILGLIITPPKDVNQIIFVFWASLLTVALKFIFAINKKHIFNPVAIAIMFTYFFLDASASWWIGNLAMAPLTVIGLFLIVRKLRRADLVVSFIVASLATTAGYTFYKGGDVADLLIRDVTHTPLVFFAAIMLTEPLTTPPTKLLRIIYGGAVGIMFAPQFNINSFYTTPEMALVVGNVFTYLVSPKYKLILNLKEKIQLSADTYDFVFSLPEKINFRPGQYMEFTFDHPDPDGRGNRRYLSLANSPTEQEIRLGIKFGNPPSSFKKNLLSLTKDQKIVGSQLIGDFTLPKNTGKKLVLVAGGIGITPFRSMLKYMIDNNEKRDVVLIYTASDDVQFVYNDVLDAASVQLGAKIIRINTGRDGRYTSDRLINDIPDFKDRIFYISGSHNVVTAFEDIVKTSGVPKHNIITDYFPGFA